MAIVILKNKLTKDNLQKAREDYENFIKITIDIEQEVIAIGGQYHADAEKIMYEQFGSKHSQLWGGGYYTDTKTYVANAMINYKTNYGNPSGDILDPKIRERFLELAKKALVDIESIL